MSEDDETFLGACSETPSSEGVNSKQGSKSDASSSFKTQNVECVVAQLLLGMLC